VYYTRFSKLYSIFDFNIFLPYPDL